MTHPTISAIIPTHNSKTEKNFSLLFVLRSIFWQDTDDVEIILVDDAGTDDSVGHVLKVFPGLRCIRSKEAINNVGYLRNLGATQALGSLLLFLDDDTFLVERNTLARIQAIMNGGNDFCCGASRLWSSLNWWKHVTDAQSTTSTARTLRDISLLPKGINRINGFRDLNEFTFIGSFGCLKADTFSAVGGFDEGFPGWGYEDTDLMMKLCLRDFRYVLLAESGISVVHLTHPVNMVGDFKRNFQRFHDLEQTRGFLFHVNHFFGVYEGDGYSVLTKL